MRRAGGELDLGLRGFGPGLPQEALPRRAEPFYRPDGARTRSSGGVGLGLRLCRRVALVHGAALQIHHSAPGFDVAMRWAPQAA